MKTDKHKQVFENLIESLLEHGYNFSINEYLACVERDRKLLELGQITAREYYEAKDIYLKHVEVDCYYEH